MTEYKVEMRIGQDNRYVEASHWKFSDGWIVFYRMPPQGGVIEYWRVQSADVISIGQKNER